MRGQVLGVDSRTGEGQVAGDDGVRYTFGPRDWAQHGEPSIGAQVDFEIDQRQARNIFPIPAATNGVATRAAESAVPTTDRNKVVAALLAFFLGTLGIHRFYLGRMGSGIVMLVLSLTFVGLIITGPWALIDAIRYLMMSDREFAARYPRD